MVATMSVLVAGGVWWTVFRNDYPCNSAKGVGVGMAIDGEDHPLSATPQDALRAWAHGGLPAMTQDPLPEDGWIEYRGRWVRDMPNDSFYEVSMTRTPRGWFAGSFNLCTRRR